VPKPGPVQEGLSGNGRGHREPWGEGRPHPLAIRAAVARADASVDLDLNVLPAGLDAYHPAGTILIQEFVMLRHFCHRICNVPPEVIERIAKLVARDQAADLMIMARFQALSEHDLHPGIYPE